MATAKTNQHICPTTFFALRRGATTPHHGKISPPLASPEKSQRTIFKSSDRWRPPPKPLHLTSTSVRVLIKTKNQNTTINQTRLVVVDAVVPTHDEDNPACSVGTSRRRRRKKGEHIHAYCLFHFIIFILHHPNVILCRYHRRRIDKGGDQQRRTADRCHTREAGAGKEMRRRAAERSDVQRSEGSIQDKG